jgi:WD40 repeat protein
MGKHKKLLHFLRPDPAAAAPAPAKSSSTTSDDEENDDAYYYCYGAGDTSCSTPTTPSTAASPYSASPWTQLPGLGQDALPRGAGAVTGLLGSLVKEGGHVYSLAAAGELLYTGTDSRNVRVWRDRREQGGFQSGSGLVKAIVVAGDGRVYTGHQDGKVRVWRRAEGGGDDRPAAAHRRVGSLPRLRDVLRSSLRPSQYVRTRRHRSALWMRHTDAVSSLSVDAAAGLIYSASWDRTFKVWRASDSRCLESVHAHADAVNAIAAASFDALVLTGSADGTVKVWRREARGDGKGAADTWHTMERVLREGAGAVTAIAVAVEARVVYVGSSDGAVAHWQWRRGAPPGAAPRNGGALRGHRMAVLCLAVAGRVVVSGSTDRTVSVWRRGEGADHSRLAVLAGHAGPVKCVAINQEEEEEGTDDGAAPRRWVVYSGSLDGSVKVWRVSDSDRGSGAIAADLTTATTPARFWKASSPSPLRSWTPYAATPEPEHMGAA